MPNQLFQLEKMHEKYIPLGIGIVLVFVSFSSEHAWPIVFVGAGFLYNFFTHDKRQFKEALDREKRCAQWAEENAEEERLAKIRAEKYKVELEKICREKKLIQERKDNQEKNQAIAKMKFSYVYVLSNDSMPDIIKIGHTDKDPLLRAAELSKVTGVPTPFFVARKFSFASLGRAHQEEKRLHGLFEKQRINANREFFRLSVSEVDKNIKDNIKSSEMRPVCFGQRDFNKDIPGKCRSCSHEASCYRCDFHAVQR